MKERHDAEYRQNGSNSEVTKEETKTPWLKSLMVFCNEVSVVGLRFVANTSASVIRRSIWFLLILAGAAFTTYQIQDRVRYYLRHPVNVIILEEYADDMAFPAVTTCNENRASLSKTKSIGTCCVVLIIVRLLRVRYSKCCTSP